jgi:hypothetical protein
MIAQFALSPALAADWGYDGEFAETNKFGFDRPARKDSPAPEAPPEPEPTPVEEEDTPQKRMKELDDINEFPTPQVNKPLKREPAAKPRPKPIEHLDATADSLPDADGNSGGPGAGTLSTGDEYGAANEYDPNNPAHNIGGPTSLKPDSSPGIAESDPQWPLISSWMNILGLVTQIDKHGKLPEGPDYSVQLTQSQRNEFSVILKKLLNGSEQTAFRAIGGYWPALSKLLEDPDHRSNYRLLFRSLLSMRADSKDISAEERMMLAEALGPKRIAEIGPPPLTEDAIAAYTDMACFLYEHNHAGKTVDADDNRELYELIVRDKFANAPTAKDKAAMNDFPLSWAKFRILYTDANESEKLLLATRIASEQGTKGLNIRNAMLEEVLSCPVWKRFVISANVSAKELSASMKSGSPGTAHGARRGGARKTSAVAKPAATATKSGASDSNSNRNAASSSGERSRSVATTGTTAKKSGATAGASTVKPKRPL